MANQRRFPFGLAIPTFVLPPRKRLFRFAREDQGLPANPTFLRFLFPGFSQVPAFECWFLRTWEPGAPLEFPTPASVTEEGLRSPAIPEHRIGTAPSTEWAGEPFNPPKTGGKPPKAGKCHRPFPTSRRRSSIRTSPRIPEVNSRDPEHLLTRLDLS